jgi:hypothetical protein
MTPIRANITWPPRLQSISASIEACHSGKSDSVRREGAGQPRLLSKQAVWSRLALPKKARIHKGMWPSLHRGDGSLRRVTRPVLRSNGARPASFWSLAPPRGEGSIPVPLPPPFLRYSSFQYPIVRIHREITEEPCDVALILRESCSFFAVGFGGQISREGRRTSRRTASSRPALSPASCRSSGSGEPSVAHSPNPVRFKPASVILTTSVTHDSNFVF